MNTPGVFALSRQGMARLSARTGRHGGRFTRASSSRRHDVHMGPTPTSKLRVPPEILWRARRVDCDCEWEERRRPAGVDARRYRGTGRSRLQRPRPPSAGRRRPDAPARTAPSSAGLRPGRGRGSRVSSRAGLCGPVRARVSNRKRLTARWAPSFRSTASRAGRLLFGHLRLRPTSRRSALTDPAEIVSRPACRGADRRSAD